MPENIDFVVCKLCGWHARRLAGHLRKEHNLSVNEYDGPVLCKSSEQKYKSANCDNGNWIEKAKARGEDLTEYKQKMGQAVREAILSNPDDRKRRAEVMAKVNKSDVMRKKASETAIKTSARKDIQEARAARLQKWRDENSDEFYDKCISKILNVFNSKPETLLYEKVKDYHGYNLLRHRKLRSSLFKPFKQRDVDIGDSDRRVYIEFDGRLHFEETSLNQLKEVQEKDRLLDEHITKHDWTLIRVSYDQF